MRIDCYGASILLEEIVGRNMSGVSTHGSGIQLWESRMVGRWLGNLGAAGSTWLAILSMVQIVLVCTTNRICLTPKSKECVGCIG